MKIIKSYKLFESNTLDRPLCYMFNDNFTIQDLLHNSYVRYNSIRQTFWNNDLSSLSNYNVIINSHDDGPDGTFIVHNDVLDVFIETDDFSFSFKVSDYNNRKINETKPKDIDLVSIDQIGFRNDWKNNKEQLLKKLDWTFLIEKNLSNNIEKCVAVMPYDYSWRFDDNEIFSYYTINYSEYFGTEKVQILPNDAILYLTWQEKYNSFPF